MKEFDALSERYHAGFDDPLKALAGDSVRDFLRPKAQLLFEVANKRFGKSLSSGIRLPVELWIYEGNDNSFLSVDR